MAQAPAKTTQKRSINVEDFLNKEMCNGGGTGEGYSHCHNCSLGLMPESYMSNYISTSPPASTTLV